MTRGNSDRDVATDVRTVPMTFVVKFGDCFLSSAEKCVDEGSRPIRDDVVPVFLFVRSMPMCHIVLLWSAGSRRYSQQAVCWMHAENVGGIVTIWHIFNCVLISFVVFFVVCVL